MVESMEQTIVNPTFSEKLIAWRTSRRWTQAAAVEWLTEQTEIQISLRTYQGWEGGKTPLGIARAVIERTLEQC